MKDARSKSEEKYNSRVDLSVHALRPSPCLLLSRGCLFFLCGRQERGNHCLPRWQRPPWLRYGQDGRTYGRCGSSTCWRKTCTCACTVARSTLPSVREQGNIRCEHGPYMAGITPTSAVTLNEFHTHTVLTSSGRDSQRFFRGDFFLRSLTSVCTYSQLRDVAQLFSHLPPPPPPRCRLQRRQTHALGRAVGQLFTLHHIPVGLLERDPKVGLH